MRERCWTWGTMTAETAITPAVLQERGLRGLSKDEKDAAQRVATFHELSEKVGTAVGATVAGRTYGDFSLGPMPAPYAAALLALIADFTGLGGDGMVVTGIKEAAYAGAAVEWGITQAIAAGKVSKL